MEKIPTHSRVLPDGGSGQRKGLFDILKIPWHATYSPKIVDNFVCMWI